MAAEVDYLLAGWPAGPFCFVPATEWLYKCFLLEVSLRGVC